MLHSRSNPYSHSLYFRHPILTFTCIRTRASRSFTSSTSSLQLLRSKFREDRDWLEVFDHEKFNNWVEKGVAPAIEPNLKLYEDVLNLGFKVILLTGRSERHRSVTVDNLINAGFKEWDQLILRISEFHNLFSLFCAGIDL
ncbi:Acid phosphatase 1 [Glycine soja]|uniref:Acid phosphatase 1 n=1 Tax=Glycine soja TaxID=3848 RepID=A0A445IL96_GLYSO|nr:Acid phosphatase 1 [Glycine soja]